MPSGNRLRNLPLLGLLLLIGPVGCGLSDYEKQIDEQRKRVQEFDDTNRLLDDPIEIPKIEVKEPKSEAPAWPFEFYLRLPKGFGPVVREKDKLPFNAPFPCFRYVGGTIGNNFFVAAGLVSDKKDADKKDAGKLGEYTPAHFRASMRRAVEEFYRRTAGGSLVNPSKTAFLRYDVKPFVAFSGELPDLSYDLVNLFDTNSKFMRDPIVMRLYFREENGKQVGIAVHATLKQTNEQSFKNSLDACLGSLDLSPDAAARRAQFLKFRRR